MIESKYKSWIYQRIPYTLNTSLVIFAVLLGIIAQLAIIIMDFSVFTIWSNNIGTIDNGFWSVSRIKAFHLGEMVASFNNWILVLLVTLKYGKSR